MANYNSIYTGDQIDAAIQKVRNPDSAPTTSSAQLVTSGGVKNALDAKAPLNSPEFSGTPTAPNPSNSDSSTRIATTKTVADRIAAVNTNLAAVKGLNQPTALAENSDLNVVTDYGVYSCASNTIAASLQHCPVSVPFSMLNLARGYSGRPEQMIVAESVIYTRTYYSSGWTDWIRHGNTDLLAPLASPEFSGAPTAPNPSASSDGTRIATTHFVADKISAVNTSIAAVKGLAQATAIAENADLNSITDNGAFYTATVAIATSLSNCPTTKPFALLNLYRGTSGRPEQFLIAEDKVFTRTKYTDGWTSWVTHGDTDALAPLASPEFTGSPKAPNPSAGNDSTRIATTHFVAGVGGLNQASAIAQNTDLDALTTPGAYSCVSNAVAGTLSHCPVTLPFSLLVLDRGTAGHPVQVIFTGAVMFTRTFYNSAWTSWYRFDGTVVT